MAKKKNGVLKLAVGIGAAAVAGKVAYDKVKAAKSKLTKEENDSAELEVASTMLYVRTEWLRLRMRSLWDVRLRL